MLMEPKLSLLWPGLALRHLGWLRSSVQVCPCIFPVQKVLPLALSIFAPISLLPILFGPPENVTCMCFALYLVSTLQFPASNTCSNFTMELMIRGLRRLVGFEIFHEALNFWCIDHSSSNFSTTLASTAPFPPDHLIVPSLSVSWPSLLSLPQGSSLAHYFSHPPHFPFILLFTAVIYSYSEIFNVIWISLLQFRLEYPTVCPVHWEPSK